MRQLVHDIHKGKNLRENLPRYARTAADLYRDYGSLELTFSAFTLIQELTEGDEGSRLLSSGSREAELADQVCALLGKAGKGETDMVPALQAIREEITGRMDLLTAYTDRFIIYEYVLNRMELDFASEDEVRRQLGEFAEEEYIERLRTFLFANKDQNVVKDRLRLVMSQIPVRMTSSKFLDRVKETMTLYQGGDIASLNSFVYMLQTAAMVYEPARHVGEYGELEEALARLEQADYGAFTEDEYNDLAGVLEEGARRIHELTDFYYSLQKVANGIYAMCLLGEMPGRGSKLYDACRSIWVCLAKREYLEEMLVPLEGRIEPMVEQSSYLESVLFEIQTSYKKQLEETELTETFRNLGAVANLLSDSLFAELFREEEGERTADAAYVQRRAGEVVDQIAGKLKQVSRPVKRAIMAQVLDKLPPSFENSGDAMDYIRLNLFGCQNPGEKCVVLTLLRDLMREEESWQPQPSR